MTVAEKKTDLVKRRTEQILAVAKRIFAQNGFRLTQLDHIAADLNVGKGTLYRYFKDKKSLFLAVFEHGVQSLQQTITANVDPIPDPKAKIAAVVKTFFRFFDNDPELIEIMMQVRSEFKDDYRRIYVALYKDYMQKIQENFRNGINAGIFRVMDVEKTAEALSSTLQGILQGFYVREFGPEGGMTKKEFLTDKTEAVTSFLLEGILKRGNQ